MSDIGLAGGVGEEQISDSGLSDAQSFTDFSPSGSDGDSYAQASANILAEPIAGRNRSNIVGSVNYDPTFAAAFDISRGLDPTNNFGGTGGLAVPSYLRPQVAGNKVLNEAGDRQMFFSPVERFLQEDLTDAIRSAQESGLGIPSLLSSGLGAIKSVFDGVSFLKDSKAGKTVEEAAEDEKRIEIADLQKNTLDPLQTDMTDPSFMAKPIDTLTKTSLDKLREPLSNIPPTPVMVNPIQRDIARSRGLGINTLPQAADLQNQQITAGEKTGQSLVDAPPRKSDVFPMSGGFILSQLSSDPTPTVNPRDNPRDPNNPGGTMLSFPDPINDPVKAPPGFVDIVVGEDKTPRFAGTNMTIFGGRDPSAKLYSPLTEAEARVATDAGFSLFPIPGALDVSQDPRDYTPSGVLTGVNLPAAEFQFKPDPENVVRVPISSLPAQAQQVAALRSGELDYGTSFPLQTILDARRSVNRGDFTQKEMSDFLAGFTRQDNAT